MTQQGTPGSTPRKRAADLEKSEGEALKTDHTNAAEPSSATDPEAPLLAAEKKSSNKAAAEEGGIPLARAASLALVAAQEAAAAKQGKTKKEEEGKGADDLE